VVTGLTATNYTFVASAGTLNITKPALTVGVHGTPVSKTYGAANPTFTASYARFVKGDTASVITGTPTFTTTAVTSSPAGVYAVTPVVTGLWATNYTFLGSAGSLNIIAAQLTVTANSVNKAHGAVNPALTYTITGFQGTDTQANSTTA